MPTVAGKPEAPMDGFTASQKNKSTSEGRKHSMRCRKSAPGSRGEESPGSIGQGAR